MRFALFQDHLSHIDACRDAAIVSLPPLFTSSSVEFASDNGFDDFYDCEEG